MTVPKTNGNRPTESPRIGRSRMQERIAKAEKPRLMFFNV